MLSNPEKLNDMRFAMRCRRRARAILGCTLPLAVALALAGCAYDPWRQAGTWQPTAANDMNLHEMIANPADLKSGENAGSTRGVAAVAPVDALISGKGSEGGNGGGIGVSTGGGGLGGGGGSTSGTGMAAGGF